MGELNSPIFARIGIKVFKNLENDAQFPEELISQIQMLFESGQIVDQAKVLNVLQGDMSEDPQSRD